MNWRVAAVAAGLLVTVLAGCGGPSGVSASGADADSGYGTRTVTDCTGTKSTFTAAPKRVAAVTTSVLEFLLKLGLKDRIIGAQAVAPGAFPPDLQKTADALPKLGGEYVPGNFVPVQREQLLSANPDFVVGGWPSNFDSKLGALSQAELTQRGLNSYFAIAAWCQRKAPVTDLSVVYQDIENYGKSFDIEDKTDAMVSTMKDTVATVREKIKDEPRPKVYSYSWEDGAHGKAYAIGNLNFANGIITQAGGENVFDDPLGKAFSLQVDEHVGEHPDVAGERFQFRTMGEYGRQDRAVLFGEIVGVSGDPASDSPSRGRSSAYRLWCGAHGAYVGADRAVAAGVALGGDLLP